MDRKGKKWSRRMKNLIIFFFIIVFIAFASVFGWRFAGQFDGSESDNVQLINRLKQHVYRLSHEIGDRSVFQYEKLNEAKHYIIQEFESLGYQVELQAYQVLEKTVENIIVTKRGNEKPDEQVIVGAHYDTCYNPGADDNASGVASLLELARFFSDKSTQHTIKFIAFVNEEPPFFKSELMGSRIYAKEAKSRGDQIKAILILEMLGFYSDKPFSQKYPPFFGAFYPNKANFIAVIGNFHSRPLVKKVTTYFKKHSSFPIESVSTFPFVPGVDFSDHWSFWKESYSAVMITDTAFYRNPHYHRASDTYDRLNYKNMAEVILGLQGVLVNFKD